MKKNLLSISIFFVFGFLNLQSQTYNTVSTFAGTGVAGLFDAGLGSAKFNAPYDICSDIATGDIYVADALNNCIRKIANGNVTTLAGNGTQGDVNAQGNNARFYAPSGVCYYNGYVYVTDNGNNKIKRIDASGNVTTYAGTGNGGYLDGNVNSANFFNPESIIADNNGTIYVSDYGNHCIRAISNGQVTTFAGVGGISGDLLGTATSARFNRPTDICLDLQGNMYVTDQLNNKVKVISNGMVSLLAGSGTMASTDGTGASASFYKPCFLGLDLYCNSLFVSEGGTNKIRRVSLSGVTSTLAGTGSAGLTNGALNIATFDTPYGICIDNSGSLYIGDRQNNVIREISIGDVGIAESLSIEQLSIFPNPTSDNFTIQNPKGDHLTEIQILNMNGKLVQDLKIENSSAEIKIDVADLPVGIYFISAISTGKNKYSGKFVKE
jgi:sugar lactone lactonase YvrE